MKLIDVLVMISKGELKEGTKIKYNNTIYKCKEGNVFDPKSGVGLLEYIYEENLNDEVEIIELDHFTDVGKMEEKIEELDIEFETVYGGFEEKQAKVIADILSNILKTRTKLNEVIRRINNE